jgi:hypothetical protein
MKPFARTACWLFLLGLVGLGLRLLPAVRAQEMRLKVHDFEMPLEYYPNGRIKTKLFAKSAVQGGNKGDAEAEDVLVVFYTNGRDKQTNATLRTGACTFSKKQQRALSAAPVKLVSKGATLEGVGFEWYGTNQCVKVLKNVRVTVQRGAKFTDLKSLMKRSKSKGAGDAGKRKAGR